MNRLSLFMCLLLVMQPGFARTTNKPILYGTKWIAITGKPLAATSGARIFEQGGNAVDAACAMLATTSTMFDVLSWGGETQALVYHPGRDKVIGVNALGVAPTGATPEFFAQQEMPFPPQYGPLAAVTPGTPGGLMVMLAEYGSMSLAQVLAPAVELAGGYPIEAQLAESIEKNKEEIRKWPESKKLFLVNEGGEWEAPRRGEIFRQSNLKNTLMKLLQTEAKALRDGKTRKEAIYAAYDRFYRGDIAEEYVRGSQAMGGLHQKSDLANWEVKIEEPVTSNYKGIDVYKLTTWVQGPVLLQSLNIAEQLDLKALGFNSAQYTHVLYQVMNLAFADRDFYYGDPYFPPEEPVVGLLSKAYAMKRTRLIDPHKNDPTIGPGDPYQFQSGRNPFAEELKNWTNIHQADAGLMPPWQQANYQTNHDEQFLAGTTSIQAADKDGWIVSITPSGGWVPAAIAGKTGIGMSQRMQSFVLDSEQNPYNVLEPGKRPRATLTPSMAFKDGKPFLSFAVQGGDIQDQVQLQFFLAMVEFGMNVQEAAEGPYFWSYQMRNSFSDHKAQPGKILLHDETPSYVRQDLEKKGYEMEFRDRTSGPINAIFFDHEQGVFQGGSSDFGEDYGVAW